MTASTRRLAIVGVGLTTPPRDGVSTVTSSILTVLSRHNRVILLAIRHPEDRGSLASTYSIDEIVETRLSPDPQTMASRIRRRLSSIRLGLPPSQYRYTTCRPWLQDHLERLQPDAVLVLGSSAAAALPTAFDRRALLYLFSLPVGDLALYRTTFLQRWLAHRWQEQIVTRFGLIAATTDSEAETLRHFSARRSTILSLPFPIGRPPGELPRGSRPRVLFIADWNYQPNVVGLQHFLEHVLPSLRHRVRNVEVVLAGSASECLDLPMDRSIIRFGRYDSLFHVANSTTVAILPLVAASGVRTRVFELLAHGIPVVATNAAVPGVDAQGAGVSLADDWMTFVNALVTLLEDGQLRARYAGFGRTFIDQTASETNVGTQWQQALSLIEERHKG